MNWWLAIIGMGVITFAIRLSMIVLADRLTLSENFYRALRYVPPAVLSAIIFPDVLFLDGQLAVSPSNPRLLAGLVAIIVAYLTKNIIFTVIAGLIAFWVSSGVFF